MKKLIQKIESEQIEILNISLKNGSLDSYSHTIECDKLENYMNIDIRKSDKFKDLFLKLKSMKGPVIYTFKILSGNEHKEIREKLIAYKGTKDPRASSALRKYTVPGSSYLYVGKVKSNISGRIINHLGYSKNKDTSGLQLFHWTKELGLKLELSITEFIPEMADLMGVIELKVAQNYHPIIGKH